MTENDARVDRVQERMRKQESLSKVHVVMDRPRPTEGSQGDMRLYIGKVVRLYVKLDRKWIFFTPSEE